MIPEFKSWSKISKFRKETYVITEKIDGTNGVIHIGENGEITAGSRNRWLTITDDNFGFAKFVEDNKEELLKLGHGYHYGEWYGLGIQRGYSLKEKKFALFNTSKWNEETKPICCEVVPLIDIRQALGIDLEFYIRELKRQGSLINGFNNPEGICIYTVEAGKYYKMLCEHDELHKGEVK